MFDFISNLFKPAADLIDSLHVSEEEKGKLKNEFAKIQASVHKETTKLMVAEAQSDNKLASSWRPLCALSLVFMILLDGFKVIDAPAQVYSLAEVFLSVYGGGRALEKVVKRIKL